VGGRRPPPGAGPLKVLVTGATGFIGANLVARLLDRGDEVRVMRRAGSRSPLLDDLAVETVPGDITDAGSVERAAAGVEGIYHVAGLVSYWRPRRAEQGRVNVAGTANVIEGALRGGVRRVVYTSSIAAVGFHGDERVSDEETPWNWGPLDIGYCITKREAEEVALAGNGRGVEVVAVNPALVFGPRDVNFNAGRIFKLVASSSTIRGLPGWTTTCDVDDVCAGHVGAMLRGVPGRRYILGGEAHPYPRIVERVAAVMGVEVKVKVVPYPAAAAAARAAYLASLVTRREPAVTPELVRMTAQRRVYSSRRAIEELGYPQTPLRASLERAFEWYRARGML
jgi:dihydroflavonol-4-reductase